MTRVKARQGRRKSDQNKLTEQRISAPPRVLAGAASISTMALESGEETVLWSPEFGAGSARPQEEAMVRGAAGRGGD